jgi:hypothetical protein
VLDADGKELSEPLLMLPLYVSFPEGHDSGKSIDIPTEIDDIHRTSVVALGHDLAGMAAAFEDAVTEPQIATLDDSFSTRWGDLILSGQFGAAPK